MDYIDILHLNTYRSKYFTKGDRGITDNLFTYGEIGVISRYLSEKQLIKRDRWGRYVVKWREKRRETNDKKTDS